MIRLAVALAILAAPTAYAQTLTPSATYSLPSQLENASCNFCPQGLGIDEASQRLLYAQYNSGTVWSTDLSGANLQSFATGIKTNFTSVAAWDGDVYYTDYSSNSSGPDMWRIDLPGGTQSQYSTFTTAYGGFPIDIRNGELYRTNLWSSSYTWANLNQMSITNVATPNGGTRTFSLSGTNGVGDFAVDLDSNSIWVLEYSASARIHQYDINSTARLATYTAVGDGLTAGLTYYNGNLYYYDHSTSNSTLTVFPTGFVAGCTDGMDPFDLDNNGDDETCIHPTAVIDDTVIVEPGARVHANVIVAPRATIGSTAEILGGAIISRSAQIYGTVGANTVVGREVLVTSGSNIGADSLLGYASTVDASDLGPQTTLGATVTVSGGSNVGDDGGSGLAVVARASTVQGGSTVDSGTVIGPGCTLSGANIGGLVRIRKNVTFATGSSAGDSARIGRDVQVGTNADIAANTHVGALSTLSANACASGVVERGTNISNCP